MTTKNKLRLSKNKQNYLNKQQNININTLNNMKEKKKVLCTNLKINAIYQFLFLALVITFIYSKTIFFEYNLDDYIITDTLAGKVNSFRDLFEILKLPYNNADYRPIVFLSFGIESLFFGELNPAISHAINCVLYFFGLHFRFTTI